MKRLAFLITPFLLLPSYSFAKSFGGKKTEDLLVGYSPFRYPKRKAINLFELHVPEDLLGGYLLGYTIWLPIFLLFYYVGHRFKKTKARNVLLGVFFVWTGFYTFIVNFYYFGKGGFAYDGWSSWIFGIFIFLISLFSCWTGYTLFTTKTSD